MGKYTQVFTLHYDADPDRVWAALQQAIDDMDGTRLGPVRQDGRELEFETGVTLTSWGSSCRPRSSPDRSPAPRSRYGASPRAPS